MKRIHLALMLAASMIAIAALAAASGVPDEVAFVVTFLPLALFPNIWMRPCRPCNPLNRGDA